MESSAKGLIMEGKTAMVAGLGISGSSAAQVLAPHFERVITVDESNARADLDTFDGIDWSGIDLLVVSPVFNPRTPFILAAQARGVEVVGEVEVAWRLRVGNERSGLPAPWVGITGTNGKTTTTQMTAAMLGANGLRAPAVGNIGKALALAAVDVHNDILCVELSSFQLHFAYSLALDYAAITNIADDHLDWHGSFEHYAADKSKVFQGVRGALVFNAQDALVTRLAEQAQTTAGCRRIGFTLNVPAAGQIGIQKGMIVDRSGLVGSVGEPRILAVINDFPHLCQPNGKPYPHLLADALTALALVLSSGADIDRCLQALAVFSLDDHHIQTVATTKPSTGKGISFVDDSKATNAQAAQASLHSFADKSVVWIGGGLAKGGHFEDLVEKQGRKMKAAVIIGSDQSTLREAFASRAPGVPLTFIDPYDNATVMTRAVEAAVSYAREGDVVLLAPAGASMDQFKSYADRGDQFADQAREWVGTHG